MNMKSGHLIVSLSFASINLLPAAALPPIQTSPLIHGHIVLGRSIGTGPYISSAPRVILVDKGSHTTNVLQLQHGKLVRVYTVHNAIGKGSTPTPTGRYLVVQKKRYPEWIPPKSIDPKQKIIPPYNVTHRNPLGVAAVYLNKFGIMLHGTNQPQLIRKSVSHGCIRHSNSDIARIYGMVHVGTPVYIANHFAGKVINEKDFYLNKSDHDKSDQDKSSESNGSNGSKH